MSNFSNGFHKQANLLRKGLGVANGLAKQVTNNPTAKKAIIGAGAGAVAGAATNIAAGDSKESIVSRGLKGAVGGAALGAGAGYAASKIKKTPAGAKPNSSPSNMTAAKPVDNIQKLHYQMDGRTIPMRNDGGIYKAAFMIGFYKQAGLAGTLGTAAAKIQKAPGQAAKFVKDIPNKVQQGAEAVKATMARNRQEAIASHAREMGFGKRAPRPNLDLSSKASKGRIMTGRASPETIKRENGTLLGKARNIAAGGLAAGAAGVYMGMKEPNREQQQQPY